jgi:predicted RNA-binding Zn-ribbon protein involved in translation (DUF1610 family)
MDFDKLYRGGARSDDDDDLDLRESARSLGMGEPSGDPEDEWDDAADDDGDAVEGERAVKVKCSTCGEQARVLPPEGHKFVEVDDDGDDALADGQQVLRFSCDECGASNKLRLKTVKLVAASESESDPAAHFRRRWARATGTNDDDDTDTLPSEPIARYRESYFRQRGGDSPLIAP